MTTPLPPGACNAHCHVFGPRERFPYAADAPFVPSQDAPREALYALNDRLGLQRCVIVQSTCHGLDNRVTEHAIAGRPFDYRGIALVRTDVANSELARLHAAGFRGVRFNYMGHLGTPAPVDAVLALASRLVPLGWHLQIHGDTRLLTEVAPALRDSPVPVVIDHIGRVDASLGLHQPAFDALCALLESTTFWVKVSGVDRITRQGPPYDDAVPLAAHLVAEFGDRVVWGNDWPHPNHAGPVPVEEELTAQILRMAPTAEAVQRLMVDNPQRLYRFESPR
ncbi:MAG: amidohydrolase family protein [Rhodoferax sp.]|nr:amidohydrolase family protein [Rhodoferax sp.]